jgi:hypothetical protein
MVTGLNRTGASIAGWNLLTVETTDDALIRRASVVFESSGSAE